MKVLVDAMSARFGGLATYVEGLAGAWRSVAPDDELHVVLAEGSKVTVESNAAVVVHRIRLRPPLPVPVPLVQSSVIPRLVRELSADVLLCVIPMIPIRRVPVPLSVIVHDLRHELLPWQFPLRRRVLRRVAYTAGYARAASLICVSERTKSDLLRLHPGLAGSPVAVVPHGADHVERWPRAPRSGHALAFGHTGNKRADLVVETWRELVARGLHPPQLHLVGLGDRAQRALLASADRAGLTGRVSAHPFLPAADFRRLLSGAGLVVFPSDFEGFGLPVLEAMKLGVPVVVGPDAAVAEVAAGHAHAARELEPVALAGAVARALRAGPAELEAARRHAGSYTWARTALASRNCLAEAVTRGVRPRRSA